MNEIIQFSKERIRSEILSLRSWLESCYISSKSNKIINKIIKLDQYKKAKKIWLYANMPWEVDLFELFNSWENKIFYFPKVIWDNIEFWKVETLEQMQKWSYWIMEPVSIQKDVKLDLIIVPWLAFTLDWKRIGYWKWYYDRYLKNKEIYMLWVCFDFQIFDDLKQDRFDVIVDDVLFAN